MSITNIRLNPDEVFVMMCLHLFRLSMSVILGLVAFNIPFGLVAFLGLLIFGQQPFSLLIGAVIGLVAGVMMARLVYNKFPRKEELSVDKR